jgi:hypothetical protein
MLVRKHSLIDLAAAVEVRTAEQHDKPNEHSDTVDEIKANDVMPLPLSNTLRRNVPFGR